MKTDITHQFKIHWTGWIRWYYYRSAVRLHISK